MSRVLWAFRGKPVATVGEFDELVRAYHLAILKSAERWHPHDLVLPFGKVVVTYEYWVDADAGAKQVVGNVDLESPDGKSFTAVALLLKLHNAVIEHLNEMDHQFFEGLAFSGWSGDIPVYELRLGS
jgi:hypothetical protein